MGWDHGAGVEITYENWRQVISLPSLGHDTIRPQELRFPCSGVHAVVLADDDLFKGRGPGSVVYLATTSSLCEVDLSLLHLLLGVRHDDASIGWRPLLARHLGIRSHFSKTICDDERLLGRRKCLQQCVLHTNGVKGVIRLPSGHKIVAGRHRCVRTGCPTKGERVGGF